MGHLSAVDFAMHADLDTTLSWHLQSNHFPPVSADFIPACKAAIQHALDEDWEAEVELPERSPKDYVTVAEIVRVLHLDGIIEGLMYSQEER